MKTVKNKIAYIGWHIKSKFIRISSLYTYEYLICDPEIKMLKRMINKYVFYEK